jgi:phosphatidylinositol 3-kinase
MIKRDDLTRDLVIMNLIKRIDKILKEEEGLDLYITTYNILPISNDFGLIEIVPDADTIYAINKRHKLSILNYILENNAHVSINDTRDRFTKSCVAYCIISYLLGIGDRHMENIMVKRTGEIFHIDFGFILGYDPKLMSPEIRLTNEMIDAMGGKTSKHYNQFKDLCTRCILCLRRHIDMFKLMLGSLQDVSITPNKKLCKTYIDKFIDSKFLIGEDFNDVKLYLINKIDSNTKIYSDTLIDFCHNSITKESTNTLSNKAYNYGSSWMNYFYGKQ